MLSQWFVFRGSKNFTSDCEIRMPPTVPLNHYFGPRNQRNWGPQSYFIIPCSCIPAVFCMACLEHSNFFKVNVPSPATAQRRAANAVFGQVRGQARRVNRPRGRPDDPPRNPTTSFLTATTLIYANGAGITAAAGTRLALHSILVKGFVLYSFRLRDPLRTPYRYFLSLPPRIGIG